MSRHAHRRGRLGLQTQMNLTSLIDVVFILLVAFMIVAPALKHGLQVDLAQVEEGGPLNEAEPISIVINYEEGDEEARFYLDGNRVTLDRLRTRLEMRRDFARLGADTPVLIEPAAAVPTEATLQVLGVVLDLGFTSPGFVTELPERPRQQ